MIKRISQLIKPNKKDFSIQFNRYGDFMQSFNNCNENKCAFLRLMYGKLTSNGLESNGVEPNRS